MKAVAETLGVSRSNLVERLKDRDRPRQRYHKAGDIDLLPALRRLVDERPTYGYHGAPEPGTSRYGPGTGQSQAGLSPDEGPQPPSC